MYLGHGETRGRQPTHGQVFVERQVPQAPVGELHDPPAALAAHRNREAFRGDGLLELDSGQGVPQRMLGVLDRAGQEVVHRLAVRMDGHRPRQIAADPQQQGEISDVAAAHFADDLAAEGSLGQQVAEPGGEADSGATGDPGIVLEDLTEHEMAGAERSSSYRNSDPPWWYLSWPTWRPCRRTSATMGAPMSGRGAEDVGQRPAIAGSPLRHSVDVPADDLSTDVCAMSEERLPLAAAEQLLPLLVEEMARGDGGWCGCEAGRVDPLAGWQNESVGDGTRQREVVLAQQGPQRTTVVQQAGYVQDGT